MKTRHRHASVQGFFIPMAFSATLMMSTHFLMSWALSATSHPEVSFATYGAAISLGGIFDSAAQTLRQIIVASAKTPETLRKLRQMSLIVASILAASMIIIGVGIYRFVFSGLLGIPPDMLFEARSSFLVLALLPVFSTFRAMGHSQLILTRRTDYMALAMMIRVLLMTGVAYVARSAGVLDGGVRGAALLVFGIGIEAVSVCLAGGVSSAKDAFTPNDGSSDAPEVKHMIASFVPLASGAILLSCSGPIITWCLSRTGNPSMSLSAYQVAVEFLYVFTSSVQVLHQVVLVFGVDVSSFRQVRRFSLRYGAAVTAIMALVNLSGFSAYVLKRLIGVPLDLVRPAVTVLGILSVLPLIYAFGESVLGGLLRKFNNHRVMLGRMAGVVCALALSWALPQMIPSQTSGAWLGALVLIGSSIADATCMSLSLKEVMEKSDVRAKA